MLYLTDKELDCFKNVLHTIDTEDNGIFIKMGTAGARGICGPGINQINSNTILKYLKACLEIYKYTPDSEILIGYDGRYLSSYYANFIYRYLNKFTKLRPLITSLEVPTPIFSYSVAKRKNIVFGIMVTASHNPKEYNGIKIFNPDGSQPSEQLTSELIKKAQWTSINENEIYFEDKFEVNKLNIKEDFKEYLNNYENYSLKSDLNLAYSPLNGVGEPFTLEELFTLFNFEYILLDNEGYLSSLFNSKVNPEDPESFNRLINQIKAIGNTSKDFKCPDLILATDPDCDRIGFMVYHNGEYIYLNGHEISTILAYSIRNLKGKVNLSYVTTSIIEDVLKNSSIEIRRTPVGFRFLSELIDENTLLSAEESCSFNTNTIIKDKDPFSTLYSIIKIADTLKLQNKTLVDYLEEICSELGKFYKYATLNLQTKDKQGVYNKLQVYKEENFLENFNFHIRESGTEPVVKVYLEVYSNENSKKAEELLEEIKRILLS